jgi:hypothetical protein
MPLVERRRHPDPPSSPWIPARRASDSDADAMASLSVPSCALHPPCHRKIISKKTGVLPKRTRLHSLFCPPEEAPAIGSLAAPLLTANGRRPLCPGGLFLLCRAVALRTKHDVVLLPLCGSTPYEPAISLPCCILFYSSNPSSCFVCRWARSRPATRFPLPSSRA